MNDLFSYFARTTNIFHSPVKDMDPTKCYTVDDGYIIVCKTLGISPDDVKISIDEDANRMSYPILKIEGSTKIESIDFENSVNLAIQLNCKEELDAIDYTVRDGLTIVHIKTKARTSKYNDIIKYNEDLKV